MSGNSNWVRVGKPKKRRIIIVYETDDPKCAPIEAIMEHIPFGKGNRTWLKLLSDACAAQLHMLQEHHQAPVPAAAPQQEPAQAAVPPIRPAVVAAPVAPPIATVAVAPADHPATQPPVAAPATPKPTASQPYSKAARRFFDN
jgi:hypothetical protein